MLIHEVTECMEGTQVRGSTAHFPRHPLARSCLLLLLGATEFLSPRIQAAHHSLLTSAVLQLQISLLHLGGRKILGLLPHLA